MEPFGEGNPDPAFVMRNLDVIEARTVGANGKHLKLVLRPADDPRRFLKAIAFGQGDGVTDVNPTGNGKSVPAVGSRLDALFSLSVNEWNGNRELEMKVTAFEQQTQSS